jgi:hypothetical protein
VVQAKINLKVILLMMVQIKLAQKVMGAMAHQIYRKIFRVQTKREKLRNKLIMKKD